MGLVILSFGNPTSQAGLVISEVETFPEFLDWMGRYHSANYANPLYVRSDKSIGYSTEVIMNYLSLISNEIPQDTIGKGVIPWETTGT